MTDINAPSDVEIYAKTNHSTVLLEWLNDYFGDLRKNTALKSSAKNQHFLAGPHENPLMVNVMDQPIRGYCALNITGDALPWDSDKMLGEAVFSKTGIIVRCSDGHWSEGADPDAWLEISSAGTQPISWNA